MDINHQIIEGYRNKLPINEICRLVNRSKSSVLERAKKLGLTNEIFSNKKKGIIEVESSFKGEGKMEPSEADLMAFQRHCQENNLPYDQWRAFWFKTKEYSSLFVNKQGVIKDEKELETFLARLRQESPKVKARKYTPKRALIPANFDVHIGKFCEVLRTDRTYNPDEAVRRVLEGQAELYKLAEPLGITDVILPLGNDIIHVDNNRNTTTSGTPQDAQGSVESMALLAVEMYVRLIEELTKNHDVWLAHISSNHDRLTGWSVSQIIANRLWNNKRVHFNRATMANTPRKYFIYGRNLIMFQHGDSKVNDVLGAINQDVRSSLADTDFTYCYQGDKHHKMTYKLGEDGKIDVREKDYNGVTVIKSQKGRKHTVHVETVRSPSEADYWHTLNNYMNLPAVEAFVHDIEAGQIARFTHYF